MAHLTLFDDNGQALCERLYFKRPLSVLNINARLNKNVFSKRDKVTIDVATSDKNNPIAANMSAAVYRLDGLHAADDREILSYLWLSSEVRGYIENPDYYFSKNDVQTNADLDDLLLTQGWRTFDWHSASTNNRRPVYVPENRGHIVTGKVTNDITGQPAENILVYLSVPGRRVQLYGCLSDAHGIVHFDLQDFYGSSQLVMQTNTQVDSIYRLEVLSPFSESPAGAAFPAFRISEKTRDELSAANLSLAVQEAYYKNELSKMEEPQIDSLPFYYRPTKTYLLDNYTRFTTMEEVLREYVIEVNVLRRKKEYHLNVFNEQGFLLQNLQPSQKIFEKDPLILLDGVPVFNVDKLIAYDPLKVQKLEVVADKYYWGPITAYGITSFTTYQGNLPGFTLNPHDIIIDYDGLQKQRIFYAPDYSSQKVLQSHLPDFRDLLYWSANVKTGASGAGSLSFYTSDVPGKYVVVLQGISPNGDAGSQQAMFEVTK